MKDVYIVAVSGGSDSMALLHQSLNTAGLVVAHVNYHHRPTANRDESIVRSFCQKHNLPIEVLDAPKTYEGNFQAFARELRYQFFNRLMKQYQAKGVLVAHQLDDVIETYLMQKNRNSIPLYYGLNKMSLVEGIPVLRPLLNYTKADLQLYCQQHDIVYGEDESNADLRYTRNKIRHEVVNQMNEKDKKSILEEIKSKNIELQKNKEEIKAAYKRVGTPFSLTQYAKEKENIRLEVLRTWLASIGIESLPFSLSKLKGLDEWCLQNKNTYQLGLYCLYKYHHCLEWTKKDVSYEYRVDTIELLDTPYFKITNEGVSTCAVTVTNEDFPLTIRNYKEGDSIKMRFGTKKINRWFIDRKIPLKERKTWPVVLNQNEDVILVPLLGCNVKHFSNNPNMFVIK